MRCRKLSRSSDQLRKGIGPTPSLRVATDLLKKNIAAQRIAWLDTDPIHALRATVKAWCGLAMVGKSE